MKTRKKAQAGRSRSAEEWPLIAEDIAIDGLLGIVHKRGTRRKKA